MAQLIFTIATGSDDASVVGVGVSWPPAFTTANATQTFVAPSNSFSSPNYTFDVTLLRWDTSSLPDNAIITSAVLRLYMTGRSTVHAGPYTLKGEWYTFDGSAASNDYTTTVSNNAHVGTDMDFFTTPLSYDYALQNLTNISLTGYTGIRLFMDGPQPTGDNYLSYDSFETAGGTPEPQLVVNYTTDYASIAWLHI